MSSVGERFPGERRQSAQQDGDIPDDPRLMQAVQEYLSQMEAGRAPNRQEFLRRFPDLMDPLSQCLDGLELVHKAAVRKKHSASGPATTVPDGTDLLPANPLGDFQIMREIGRGGMGIVYEALQLSLGRRVALKVLPFAATFDAKHLQRFHNEAQAAAQLHHTNIVPVYAVGCERGVHYYAMQLIEGQSLAAVIHQIRRQESREHGPGGGRQESEDRSQEKGSRRNTGEHEIATGPFLFGSEAGSAGSEGATETASPLSLALTTHRSKQHGKYFSTVAKFMVQTAEALEHAHQFGIVHRDIKPANLLVDVHNRLWVTDFGLAQFHADAGLTQTGDILGTLRYMSPEQASGKKVLDHRTDVYSLGATLYELVTLEPIYPGRNRQELLHQIINDEPRPPRALAKNIPIELETIILKAVAKNPAERYASAQECAADLQRYLDDKPILAKRPSMIERARKWSRRHPSVVGAGILTLIVCVVGLVASNWIIAREQAKTQAALKSEKERAVDARRAVDALVEISEEELADQPHSEGVRKRLLQRALNYYRDFIATHGSDEGAQKELERSKEHARSLLGELSTLEGLYLIDFLTTNPDVQSDLKVTDEQRGELDKLDTELTKQRAMDFPGHRPATPADRRQKLAFAKEQETKLKNILTNWQILRLHQIELQTQGPRAFHESDAVEILQLSSEQKRQIREFKNEAMQQMRACQKMNGPGALWMEMEKIMKDEVKNIIAILTPAQLARWQELIGEGFNGNVRRGPPFGGSQNDGPGKKGGPRGPKGPPPPYGS